MERRVHFAICAQVALILAKEIFIYKCLKQCLIRAFLKTKWNKTKQRLFWLSFTAGAFSMLFSFLFPVLITLSKPLCILLFDKHFLFELRKLRQSNRSFTSKKVLRKKSREAVAKCFILVTAGKAPGASRCMFSEVSGRLSEFKGTLE